MTAIAVVIAIVIIVAFAAVTIRGLEFGLECGLRFGFCRHYGLRWVAFDC